MRPSIHRDNNSAGPEGFSAARISRSFRGGFHPAARKRLRDYCLSCRRNLEFKSNRTRPGCLYIVTVIEFPSRRLFQVSSISFLLSFLFFPSSFVETKAGSRRWALIRYSRRREKRDGEDNKRAVWFSVYYYSNVARGEPLDWKLKYPVLSAKFEAKSLELGNPLLFARQRAPLSIDLSLWVIR